MGLDFVAVAERKKLEARMSRKQSLKDTPKRWKPVKDVEKCSRLSGGVVLRPVRMFGISATDGGESEFEKKVRGLRK